MFRNLSLTSTPTRRVERRLGAVAGATSRSATKHWMNNSSKGKFENHNRTRQERKGLRLGKEHPGSGTISDADAAFLRRQQQEALSGADAHMGQRRKARGLETPQSAGSSAFDYDSVDETTGCSVLQQRFDALVREALLKYGPPLPADFASSNDLEGVSYQSQSSTSASHTDDGADGKSFYFHEEVHVKLHELFEMIRRVDPSFSVYTHCGGIPFSLLVKNSLYLRAWGGEIHFMRCFTQSGQSGSATTENDRILKVSLAKYKMREAPSSDGLRQGPQPWIHSYRMF